MIDAKSLVMGTLATDAFTVVNKKVLKHMQGDGTLAIMLCELISIYKYMVAHNSIDELGSFPLPIVFLKRTLCLSEYKQKRALDNLQARGLVVVTRVGMPAGRRVALNFEMIAGILDEEASKEKEIKDKAREFYTNINEVSNDKDFNAAYFHEALDNIREPLAGCMYLLTKRVRNKTKLKVEWTSSAVGAIKSIVNHYNKHDTFDYGRFKDLLEAEEIKDFQDYIVNLFNRHKRIIERSPENREYIYD